MKQALELNVIPGLDTALELEIALEPLPNLEDRRAEWKERYKNLGQRANLCSRLNHIFSDEEYQEYERKRICFVREMFRLALAHGSKKGLVLDLGAGMGSVAGPPGNLARVAIRLGMQYAAVDFVEESLSVCRGVVESGLTKKKLDLGCFNTNAGTQPESLKEYESASVSVILAVQLIQHLNREEVEELFVQAKRILKKKGTMILQFPSKEFNNPRAFDLTRTRLWSVDKDIKDFAKSMDVLGERHVELSVFEKSCFMCLIQRH